MEIFLASEAGFCFGVRRAIRLAFQAAKCRDLPVYTLGPIIHNPQVVARLEKKGVRIVEDTSKIKKGRILIRSHGIDPRLVKKLKDRNLELIDATCPFVRRAQELARQLIQDGYQVIIIGDEGHPEVEAIKGSTDGKAKVVGKVADLDSLPLRGKMGVVVQTTFSFEEFQGIVSNLLRKGKELKIYNTICNSTSKRQNSTAKVARQVDLMIIIGGRNSANTTRLAEISRKVGVKTYHIETAAELDTSWLKGAKKVGVAAGASTPSWIIKELIERLEDEDQGGT